MENVLLGLDFILFAQTIALMKSLSLGITPDNPCPTGEVEPRGQGRHPVPLHAEIIKTTS